MRPTLPTWRKKAFRALRAIYIIGVNPNYFWNFSNFYSGFLPWEMNLSGGLEWSFYKAILGKQMTPEMRRTTLAGLNLNCSTLETVAGGDAAGDVLYI